MIIELKHNPYNKTSSLYIDNKDQILDENIQECLKNGFQITEKLIGYICDLANAGCFQFYFTGERKYFLEIENFKNIFNDRNIECNLEYIRIESVDSLLRYLVDENIIIKTNFISSNTVYEEDKTELIAWTRTQFIENRDRLKNELENLEESICNFNFNKSELDNIKQSLLNDFKVKLKKTKFTSSEIEKTRKELYLDANNRLSKFVREEIKKSIYFEKMGNIHRIQEDIHQKLNLNMIISPELNCYINNEFTGKSLLLRRPYNPYVRVIAGISDLIILTFNRYQRNKAIEKYCNSVKLRLYEDIDNWEKTELQEITLEMRNGHKEMKDDFERQEIFIKMTEI